ncbi:MAG: hypothetical protein ACRCTQ_06440 [Brevinemataceae bacterium]
MCYIIYDALQEAGADMLYHGMNIHYNTDTQIWAPASPMNGYEELSTVELLNQIFEYHYTSDPTTKCHGTACFAFKTSILQQIIKEENIIKKLFSYEDLLTNIRYISNCNKCVCIDKKLYYYRIGSGKSLTDMNPEFLLSKI